MSDMDIGQSQDTAPPVSAVESQAAAPVSQPAPEPKPERTFKQQEVADILTRERKDAVERYKRSVQPAQSPSQDAQHQAMTQDDVRRMAAEEAQHLFKEEKEAIQRNAAMQEAERTAADFFGKLSAGKEKYQDFDQVMGSVKDWGKLAPAVGLANMVDNTSDVMYELISNPTKIAEIHGLMKDGLTDLAEATVRRMSAALKANEQATNTKLPNAPLSQMRPSNTGTDSGVLSVSDYKKKYGPNFNWNRR